MRLTRLHVLGLIALALVGARLAFPPEVKETFVVQAAVRDRGLPVGTPSIINQATFVQADPESEDADVPGDAFAVRVVAPPPALPRPLAPMAAVAPPAPLAPRPPVAAIEPPLPWQVIGTWDDGGLLAVFVATPTGTLVARQGSVLMADYQVTNVTPRAVSLTQISTHRTLQLPVPMAATR